MHFIFPELKALLTISFLIIIQSVFAVSADSLKALLDNESSDSIKIRLYIELGEAYETLNTDSQLFYYKKAEKQAMALAEKGSRYNLLYAESMNLQGFYYAGKGEIEKATYCFAVSLKTSKELMQEGKDTEIIGEATWGLSRALLNTASIRYLKSDYTGAVTHYQAAIYVKKQIDDKSGIALCINNIGLIYMAQGMDDKATASFQEALSMWAGMTGESDENKSSEIKRRMSMAYLNLGIIQKNQKNYEKAIEYYQLALDIRREMGDSRAMSECYLNMGVAYRNLGESDKAFIYYDKALFVFEKAGDKKAIMRANNNIGTLFTESGNWEKALTYLTTAYDYAIGSGDKQAEAHILNNLADLYSKQNLFAKSLQASQRAFALADSIGSLPEKVRSYYQMMEAFAGTGKNSEALYYARKYISANDSLQGSEKMKTIQEMESRFQAEKKQQEIEKQKLTIRSNEEEMKRKDAEAAFQKIMLFSMLAVLLLLVFLIWFIYRGYRIKKKAHRDISLKNNQLEQAQTEIMAQRDEILAQRDAISNQKVHLQKALDEQIDSIRYAQRIQKALIPAFDILEEIIKENNPVISDFAVYFRPKDIVSGDFYWAARTGDRLIFCVADCTGHGVPGAFMSMLGVSYLNEIIQRHNVHTAADILNELRASIVVSLRQQKAEDGSLVKQFNPAIPMNRDSLHEVKDGMDISLCVLNIRTRELQFAGANNSLYHISTENNTNVLNEIKGDKMPVGVYLRMEPFTNKIVNIGSGDVLYLLSDGFADQFGGGDYKKFGMKRFRNLLEKNAGETLEAQKKVLDTTFSEWKEGYQQLDDICIFSVRIN